MSSHDTIDAYPIMQIDCRTNPEDAYAARQFVRAAQAADMAKHFASITCNPVRTLTVVHFRFNRRHSHVELYARREGCCGKEWNDTAGDVR